MENDCIESIKGNRQGIKTSVSENVHTGQQVLF